MFGDRQINSQEDDNGDEWKLKQCLDNGCFLQTGCREERLQVEKRQMNVRGGLEEGSLREKTWESRDGGGRQKKRKSMLSSIDSHFPSLRGGLFLHSVFFPVHINISFSSLLLLSAFFSSHQRIFLFHSHHNVLPSSFPWLLQSMLSPLHPLISTPFISLIHLLSCRTPILWILGVFHAYLSNIVNSSGLRIGPLSLRSLKNRGVYCGQGSVWSQAQGAGFYDTACCISMM